MPDIFDLFRLSTLRRYSQIMFWLARWLMRLFSASVEVYLHHNFGRRYLATLLCASFFCAFITGFSPRPMPLTPLFAAGSIVLTIRHCVVAFSRRGKGSPEPHSLSTGQSWRIWDRLRFHQATVQCYTEPALCLLLGILLAPIDPLLSCWLLASGFSLFVKAQATKFATTRRILDATDARIEAQALNAGVTNFMQRQGQAAQRSHRARRARNLKQRSP